MSAVDTIGKADLARHTRQVLDRVRRGQTVIIESYGQEEAAIVSIVDYRLLRAVSAYRSLPSHLSPSNDSALAPRGLADQQVDQVVQQAGGDAQAAWNAVITAYLDGDISLGRAAELLHVSRFELMESLNQAGITLRLGSPTVDEAQAELQALRGH